MTTTSFCRPDVIIFSAQVLLLFIVVLGSLINLTFFTQNKDMWQMLLTSSLGYMLPNPQFKIGKTTLELPPEMGKIDGIPHEVYAEAAKRPGVATAK